MKIEFKAFIKKNEQIGLVSGDKAHKLTFHEVSINDENNMKLAIAPTNKQFKVIMELEE